MLPQTERSRLDYPVSALDVAVMGTLSRLPWWRPPGRAERRAALAALDRVGLADRAGVRFGELSGGQRQRVLLARALVQEARLLLLDEPFSGMDAPSAARTLELIDELAADGHALLIATHDVDQARALGPGAVPEPPPGRVRRAGRGADARRGGGDVRRPRSSRCPAAAAASSRAHHHDHGHDHD